MVSLLGLAKLSENELERIRTSLLNEGELGKASAVASVLIAKQKKRLRGR